MIGKIKRQILQRVTYVMGFRSNAQATSTTNTIEASRCIKLFLLEKSSFPSLSSPKLH